MRWVGTWVPARRRPLCFAVFGGRDCHGMYPLSYAVVGFASGRRTLPLPLLGCCSLWRPQLSGSQFGRWTLSLIYLSARASTAYLPVWTS